MEAVVIADTDRQAWDDFVMNNPSSIAWQSYGWSEVVRKHYGVEFHPLVVFDGPRICGILPLYHMKNIRGRHELVSVPYAVAGGILADDPAVQKLLTNKAVQMSDHYGSCRITLKQYKKKIDGKFRIDDNYYNRELSLTTDTDKLWASISEQNREKVTDALRSGAVLEYPFGDTTTFHKLVLRHHHRRGIPCVGKRWIEDLLAFQMYSMAVMKVGGRIVAGTMVKEFKDTISFPFTCLAEDGSIGTVYAYALYWKLIEHFAKQGKAIFHSGRIPNSDDTEPHRLGWGGVKHPYFYQYLPSSVSTTEFAERRGRKRALFEVGWKRLPLKIAGLLGPRVVKYFP